MISVYIFKKIFIKKGKVLKCKRIWLFTINVLRVIKTMDNACRGYRKDTFLLVNNKECSYENHRRIIKKNKTYRNWKRNVWTKIGAQSPSSKRSVGRGLAPFIVFIRDVVLDM